MPIYSKEHITKVQTELLNEKYGSPEELKQVVWMTSELYIENVKNGIMSLEAFLEHIELDMDEFTFTISIYSHYNDLDIPEELFNNSADVFLCIVFIAPAVLK